MRTFNSACNTITVSFDTLTKGIERTAHSLSSVIDAVDTSVSTINDLASIAKSWSEDLRWEQQKNRDTKRQEILVEAAIRRDQLDSAIEQLLQNRKERGEDFAKAKSELLSKIENNQF